MTRTDRRRIYGASSADDRNFLTRARARGVTGPGPSARVRTRWQYWYYSDKSPILSSDATALADPSHISPINIVDELTSCYLAYAMSIIVTRDLPGVRHGMTPEQLPIVSAWKTEG